MSFTFDEEWWEDKETYYLNKAEQGTDEWKNFRKFRITASNFGAAIGLSKFSTPTEIAEDTCNIKLKTFDEKSVSNMAHGTMMEPLAREWYCNKKGVNVVEVGLAVPKWNNYIGASLDGDIVGTDGMIEIKSPKKMYFPIKKHMEKPPFERKEIFKNNPYYHDHIWDTHYAQMQGAMMITNKKWCDYIVYASEDNLVFCERVLFNKNYWENYLYPKLQNFIETEMKPLIDN